MGWYPWYCNWCNCEQWTSTIDFGDFKKFCVESVGCNRCKHLYCMDCINNFRTHGYYPKKTWRLEVCPICVWIIQVSVMFEFFKKIFYPDLIAILEFYLYNEELIAIIQCFMKKQIFKTLVAKKRTSKLLEWYKVDNEKQFKL